MFVKGIIKITGYIFGVIIYLAISIPLMIWLFISGLGGNDKALDEYSFGKILKAFWKDIKTMWKKW